MSCPPDETAGSSIVEMTKMAVSTDDLIRRIESLRGYLTLIARRNLRPELAAKLGASDLVQETILIAVQKAPEFRDPSDGTGGLRAWLRSILFNRFAAANAHYLKAQKRNAGREVSETLLIDQASSPSVHLARHERTDAIQRALARLPEDLRSVLVCRYWERLGYEAIGERLGISTDSARRLGGRALIRLRYVLGSDHEPN